MLNFFYRIKKFKNKTYDVSTDTLFLEKKMSEGVEEVLFIKKHWLFVLFRSKPFFAINLLFIINSFLIYKNLIVIDSILTYTCIGLLAFFTITFDILTIKYLYSFSKLSSNKITKTSELIKESKEGDTLFIRFFNQINLNVTLFYIGIIFFSYKTIVFNLSPQFAEFETINKILFDFFAFLNVTLFYFQTKLIYNFFGKVEDLEMDFIVAFPGKMKIVDQTSGDSVERSLGVEKIKLITAQTVNKLQNFFDIGKIRILTEGDNQGKIDIYFIKSFKVVANDLERILHKEPKVIVSDEIKKLFQMYSKEIGADINFENHKIFLDHIKEYTKKMEKHFKNKLPTLEPETQSIVLGFLH